MAQQDPNESDLAYGWAEMQDQYGVYYINLYSKQTSRIKPVRASIYSQNTLPPPPPEDDNDKSQNNQQQVPQSPISNNMDAQQAMQQQMYNQQLYQQQWQQYYAQQQYMQQYQQQMYMQQMAQQQQMGQQQMNQQYNPQMAQMQQQYPPPQQGGQMYQQGDDEESTVSSSAGTGTDDEEESDDNLADDNNQNQQQNQNMNQQPQMNYNNSNQNQFQQQPQQQQMNQMQQGMQNMNMNMNNNQQQPEQNAIQTMVRPVPPINNNNNNGQQQQQNGNDAKSPQNEKVLNQAQFRFQPIMPPAINMPASQPSNDNNGKPMLAGKDSNLSNYSNVNISPMPSPAFNPNKLSSLAAQADFTGDLPPENDNGNNISGAIEGNDFDIQEINDNSSAAAPANQSGIAAQAPEPMINKQQSTIFGVMLQTPDKSKHLAREVTHLCIFVLHFSSSFVRLLLRVQG